MKEIIQIYEQLKVYLGEIKITSKFIKNIEGTGEYFNGDEAYTSEESLIWQFNGKPLFPFLKELESILASTERRILVEIDLNIPENKSFIEQVIEELIVKIHSRETLIFDSDYKASKFQIHSQDISKIIDKLVSHKNRLYPNQNDTILETENIKKKTLIWCKSDTALLELIAALMEIKAVNNHQNNLTRKEAIDTFSKLFGIEIKDAESKLSRATERKRDVSFPTALKESFDNYVIRKDQK
jgi:hypothetical protein